MGPGIQEWIHKLEEGEGTRFIRFGFAILLLLGLTAAWHIREAKNFASIEAMDAAQLARNIAQGKGYTTDFVRPLSMAMIERQRGPGVFALKEGHPDLANAPVYPAVLAGLMKVLPFKWDVQQTNFQRYQPEVLINIFNQLLFFFALFMVYRLAKRLFDPVVGAAAVVLMALTEICWEFTTSGLPSMLLLVLFLALVNCLLRIEEFSRDPVISRSKVILWSLLAGVTVAAMCLTQYSFGWLLLPAFGFVAIYAGSSRVPAMLSLLAVFVLCISPWIIRNLSLSGTPFGTATYAIHQETAAFPGTRLPRVMPRNISLELNKVDLKMYVHKLITNTRAIISEELPRAAGNWIAAFFLAAMFIPFRNPALSRIRYFLLSAILVLIVVQALGATEVRAFSPVVNSENLLFPLMPLLFIFGAAFFFILLDQLQIENQWLRQAVIVGFILLMSLPLALRLLPPRGYAVNYPPYYPPVTQEVSRWLAEDEMMMSDMPWAVAWYGDRQCVWTTLDAGARKTDDFYRVNDYGKLIKGLYLTPITTDSKFLTEMRQSGEGVWGRFYLDVVVLKNLPLGFPLQTAPPSLLPDQLFLSDHVRWNQ